MSCSHIPGCIEVGLGGCKHSQQGGRTAHTVQIVGHEYGDLRSTLAALLESLQESQRTLIGFLGHTEQAAGEVFSGQDCGKHTFKIAEHSIIFFRRHIGRIVVELIKDPDSLIYAGIDFIDCGHDQPPGLNGGVLVPRGGVGKNMPSNCPRLGVGIPRGLGACTELPMAPLTAPGRLPRMIFLAP